MTILKFISRVGFLSNLCMLIAWFMRYANPINDTTIQSTIIILGFVVAFICNLVSNSWIIFIIVTRRKNKVWSPFISIFNFLCFIFQIYLLVK